MAKTKKKKVAKKKVGEKVVMKVAGEKKVAKEVVEKALMDGKARKVVVAEKSGTKGWIRFPRWPDWLRFFSIIVSIGLAIGWFLLFVKFWRFLELGNLLSKGTYSIGQFLILPWFVVGYVLISLPFFCFCAWWKKGFRNLKMFCGDRPVFRGFVRGFVIGLIIEVGIGFLGFLIGSIAVIDDELICGLVGGSIVGFIVGIVFGLFIEIFGGLGAEFKEN